MNIFFKYRLYKDTQIPGMFITTNTKDLDFSNLKEGNYILELKTITDDVESNLIVDYFSIKDNSDGFVIKNVYGQLIKFFYKESKFQILTSKDLILYKDKIKYFGDKISSGEINKISTLVDYFVLRTSEKIFFEGLDAEYGTVKITDIAFEGNKKGIINYKQTESNEDFKQLKKDDIIILSKTYIWEIHYILEEVN